MAEDFEESIDIEINYELVKTIKGSLTEIYREKKRFKNMAREEFLDEFPEWEEEVKENGFHLVVDGEFNLFWGM